MKSLSELLKAHRREAVICCPETCFCWDIDNHINRRESQRDPGEAVTDSTAAYHAALKHVWNMLEDGRPAAARSFIAGFLREKPSPQRQYQTMPGYPLPGYQLHDSTFDAAHCLHCGHRHIRLSDPDATGRRIGRCSTCGANYFVEPAPQSAPSPYYDCEIPELLDG